MNFSYSDFEQFINFSCDRQSFIVEYLSKKNVKTAVIPINERKHIYVVFPTESYDSNFKIKTVIAHYDRFPGTQGANDNSFAVFALMNWAIKINEDNKYHNIRLIFTDGEELFGSSCNSKEQGAYGLAVLFKRLNIVNDEIFVFDCMGRGQIPIISKQTLPENISSIFRKKFCNLYKETIKIIQAASYGNYMILPVSYSDNAGFLACGIPAVAVTMLPYNETNEYSCNLKNVPELESFVLNKKIPQNKTKTYMEQFIPFSWKLLHTEKDNISSLSSESIKMFEKILEILTKLKVMN